MKKLILLPLAAFLVCLVIAFAYQVKIMPGVVIATTKSDLLQRLEVNKIGYTDVMFNHEIDPRSEGFTGPQTDTLYASAWFDLKEEPIILIQGRMDEGRYWVHQFVTTENVVTAYITAKVDGHDGGTFMLVGPNYQGEAPAAVDRVVTMATNEVWDLYRTYSGVEDFEQADSQRRDIQVMPLSAYLAQR